MKLLITGGAGYLGSALVNHFLNLGHIVIVVDSYYKGRPENIYSFAKNPRFQIHKIDIRDTDKVKNLLEQEKPEVIIHAAAIVDAFTTNTPDKEILCGEVIRDATINLWNMARSYDFVKQFINTSTVSLYSVGKLITEDADKTPISVYGKTKWEAEKIIMGAQDDVKTTSLRPATITGFSPGIRYETVINNFILSVALGKELTVFSEAMDNQKSFLSIVDACKAFEFCVNNPDVVNGESFNVVSYQITMREVIDLLKKEFSDVKITMINNGNTSQQVYTVSGEKFNDLGFVPTFDLEKQISLLNEFLHKQGVLFDEFLSTYLPK